MTKSKITKTVYRGVCVILIGLVSLSLPSCGSSTDDVGSVWGLLNDWVGITWELESYGTIGQETALIAGTEITIRFERDDELSGFSGCNTYHADYGANEDGDMAIRNINGTLQHCGTPEGVDGQEADYLYILSIVAHYEIDSDGLHLYYDNKQSALHYTVK